MRVCAGVSTGPYRVLRAAAEPAAAIASDGPTATCDGNETNIYQALLPSAGTASLPHAPSSPPVAGADTAAATLAAIAERRAAATIPHAILPTGQVAPPDGYEGGYHGTHHIPPQVALRDGLPAHGTDWRLLEHVLQQGNSAFRGTTLQPADPLGECGAAQWAREGGWVYDIRNVPTWDVNKQLDGRWKMPDGWHGNPVYGENEFAIPARIPPQNIARWGVVEADRMGLLYVRDWVPNPAYDPHSRWTATVADQVVPGA
jgi:hypothetical protein